MSSYVAAHPEKEEERASQEGQPRPQAQHGPQLLTGLVWFRRDLRLADNPAWAAATLSNRSVAGLFVIDPVPMATAGPYRRNLLLAHLGALDARLRERGGSLLVISGDPRVVVPRVVDELRALEVHVNADVTAYSTTRDAAVQLAMGAVPLHRHWGNLVQPPGAVVSASTGRVHQVFTPFHKSWQQLPVEPWPDEGDSTVLDARELLAPGGSGDGTLGPPPPDGRAPMEPGEDGAQARLAAWLHHVDHYGDTRDLPADSTGTSHLSADLRWGTVAARHVLDAVGTATAGRAAFVRQLAWRDWYAHLLHDRPGLARHAMKPHMDAVAWREDPDSVAAWTEGRTGYPIVDAAMREIAATGWMHNRVRMVAASFLTKDLLVDWRVGEAHFRHLLVDWEVSQNAGNWQWVAGTGPDAAPYFRVFNPVTQGRRFDPEGDYVRRWVPELAGLAAPAIHSPWEVPPLELAAAGVILGDTYPAPIVEHAAARDRAIAAFEAAKALAPPS